MTTLNNPSDLTGAASTDKRKTRAQTSFSNYKLDFALIVLCLLARVVVNLGSGAVLWPDSINYYRAARSLVTSHVFNDGIMFTTPLYPMFLAALMAIGETRAVGDLVLLLQQLLGLFAVLLIFKGGSRVFGRGVAFVAALLFGVSPLLLNYERVIQTEVLFLFFVALLIWYLSFAADRADAVKPIILGALCGLLTLCRPVAQLLPLCFIPLMLSAAQPFGRKLSRAAIFLGVYALTLIPWLVWNHANFGYWGLSTGKGINLFLRVYELSDIEPFAKSAYPEARKIYLKLKRANPDKHVYFEVRRQLTVRKKLRPVEVDRLLFAFALEGLKANPWPYVKSTLDQFWNFFVSPRNSINFCGFGHVEHLCGNPRKQEATLMFGPPAESRISWAGKLVFRYFNYFRIPHWLLAFLALLGAWLTLRRAKPTEFMLHSSLLLLIIYFALITALFNYYEDRFALQVDALLYLYALAAVRPIVLTLRSKLNIQAAA